MNEKYLAKDVTLERCKSFCNDQRGCLGIEYWKGSNVCYQCLNPEEHTRYPDDRTHHWPPSVYQKPKGV